MVDLTPRAVRLVVKPTKAICAIVGALRFGHPVCLCISTAISYGRSRCWRYRDRQVDDAGKNLVQQRELPIGDVIQAAINSGLRVEASFTDMHSGHWNTRRFSSSSSPLAAQEI